MSLLMDCILPMPLLQYYLRCSFQQRNKRKFQQTIIRLIYRRKLSSIRSHKNSTYNLIGCKFCSAFLFLLCIRTLHKSNFFCPLLAHYVKIALVVARAQSLRSIKHGSLQFKSIVIHLAKKMRYFLTSFSFCQLANSAFFMRNIVFILFLNLFEIIVPVLWILLDVIAHPLRLYHAASNFLFAKGALPLFRHSHFSAIGTSLIKPSINASVINSFPILYIARKNMPHKEPSRRHFFANFLLPARASPSHDTLKTPFGEIP